MLRAMKKYHHEDTKTRRITKSFNLPSAKITVSLRLRVLVVDCIVFQQSDFWFRCVK